ncbi:MAG: MopE-related protein, partial [Acidobacteriota bacterium]|nr:MopE-related protein [Acidobacteriota bacterium]
AFVDGNGSDITVHENGAADNAIDENYRVEASTDGSSYVLLGRKCDGGSCSFNLAAGGLDHARYVRITDLPPEESGTTAPNLGADIDAIEARHCSELCNDLDDDGDVSVDEGCDDDGDGYCDETMTIEGTPDTCPAGGGDCADDDDTRHPGAEEICGNLIDDDCDALTDRADPDLDKDGDGYGAGACGGDCDDSNPAIHPGAVDTDGDGTDNDCDGVVDSDTGTVSGPVYFGDPPWQAPAASAMVRLCPTSGATCRGPIPVDGRSGVYEFDSVPPGEYRIRAWLEWVVERPASSLS